MFVIYINKVHMFVICVNTSCNVSNFSRKKKMAIVRIVPTFVDELRLVSRWVSNEVPIRERVCNGSKFSIKIIDSRNYKKGGC